jgi:hypothetical protein
VLDPDGHKVELVNPTAKPWPASPRHHISTDGLALEAELRALETEAGRTMAERIRIEHQKLPAYRQDPIVRRASMVAIY